MRLDEQHAARSKMKAARTLVAIAAFLFSGLAVSAEEQQPWLQFDSWEGPCDGQCGIAVYAGRFVEDGMGDVLINAPKLPQDWDYDDDYLIAIALSRKIGSLWGRIDLEPEVGIAQRFDVQHETEIWGAVYFRYGDFPWNDRVKTTMGVSVGLNYASDVSPQEDERSKTGEGYRLQHFFSPEITFALPDNDKDELLIRFHHRSGVFGLMNDGGGASQYLTIGVRHRF